MKIIQVSHSDIGGGAARAAYRLHRGLLHVGALSEMIVSAKLTNDQEIIIAEEARSWKNCKSEYYKVGVQGYINDHTNHISNTLFSFNYPGIDISEVPQVIDADIINLHWVSFFYQSPVTLGKIFALGKPVIWTLHDQWPFTGGCHYSAGCTNYQESCSSCPQLSDDLFGLPSRILMDKVELFRNADLTIVTPSRWMKESAEKSRLFGGLRIEVIPYSLETDIFTPVHKKQAKELLGLGPDVRTLLFGAYACDDKRKGYDVLLRAISHCSSNPKVKSLLAENKIILLAFGHPGNELNLTGIPVRSFGYIKSSEMLRDIYSAADLFVLPSLEDNLPNTMLEAMSCGTPVVAFEVGGVPDVVKNGLTGRLVTSGNAQALGTAVVDLLSNTNAIEEMGKRCRALIEDKYRLDIQANKYLALYADLKKKKKSGGYVSKDHADRSGSFPSRYVLAADTSTGSHFTEIDKIVKDKVRHTMVMRKLDELQDQAKQVFGSACFYSKKFPQQLISKCTKYVKKNSNF